MRPRQRGQVLPLAVICLFVVSLFMYFAVSSGQWVDQKIRVINAADAAAYSAATVEARALNFGAYANRAIIANQVAIAQALSIASWANYFADLWLNLDHATERLGALIPPDDLLRWGQLQATLVGEAYATVYGGVDPREIAQYVNYAAGAVITASDLASQGLQLSESAVRNSLRAAAIPGSNAQQRRLAEEAAQIADPQVKLAIVPVSHGFDSFVKLYEGGDRARLADVVLRSRDDFSRERRWTLRNLLGLFGSKRFERNGSTDFSDFDHWQAHDELEYRSSGGLFSGSTHEVLAAGWAAVGGAPESGSPSADYFLPGLFSGLPDTYDLRDAGAADPRTGVSVLASKPAAGMRLQARPSGRLAVFDADPPGRNISALSRAEVFFERPDRRADGREERGSTFSPYWRVRLVPPVPADHLYAAGQQDGVVLP
jgi:hypothetical protein